MASSFRSPLISVDLNVSSMRAHSKAARFDMSQYDNPVAFSTSSMRSTSMHDLKKPRQGNSTTAKNSTEILPNILSDELLNDRLVLGSWSHDSDAKTQALDQEEIFRTMYSISSNKFQTPVKNAAQKTSILKAIQHKFNHDLIPLTPIAQTPRSQRKEGEYAVCFISPPFKVQHTFEGDLISIEEAQKRQQAAKVNYISSDISLESGSNLHGRPRLLRAISAHTPIKFVSVRRPSINYVSEDYIAHRATVQWMTQYHTILPVTSASIHLDCMN